MDHTSMPLAKLYAASLSIEELCLVEPLTVGCHVVARGWVTPLTPSRYMDAAEWGSVSSQRLRFRDANVAIKVDGKKLAIAAKAGARYAINSTREDIRTRLQEISDGQGPDVIIEAIGRRIHIARRSRRLPSRGASFTSDTLRIW